MPEVSVNSTPEKNAAPPPVGGSNFLDPTLKTYFYPCLFLDSKSLVFTRFSEALGCKTNALSENLGSLALKAKLYKVFGAVDFKKLSFYKVFGGLGLKSKAFIRFFEALASKS